MKRILNLALVLVATSATAGTFELAPLMPEAGVSVLDRSTARATFQRDLFGSPHASAVIGRVDIYDRFPYVEARYYQIVSDPEWNRLLVGESGRGLHAFDGVGTEFGELGSPRGLDVDEQGRLYVADTDNDRVLVFETRGEFDELELIPRFAVEGISHPHDVAYSDGGTPFERGDDRLYVAETGQNRVARLELNEDSARVTARLGALGSGEGRFAGPTAIAVGRSDGRATDEIFVAESHGRRLVRLIDDGNGLRWDRELQHDLPEITDLDTDHNGNLYAASPRGGEVRKYTRDLLPLASLREGVDRPRSFHVPMLTVHDHIRDTVRRAGHGSGVVVEHWGDRSGLKLLDLGVEVRAVAVTDEAVEFTLTDDASVRARIVDRDDGRVLRDLALGNFASGASSVHLAEIVEGLPTAEARLEIEAISGYDESRRSIAGTEFSLRGDQPGTPTRAAVLGASPNPFNPRTTVEFFVPSGPSLAVEMDILDARGRVVRHFAPTLFAPGRHGMDWDGTDDGGQRVSSGVFLYRVRLDDESFSGKLALVK